MNADLSRKELKATSAALPVAMEIAKERLGTGEYADHSMLLRDLTTEQLDEFIRISRELKGSIDGYLIPASAPASFFPVPEETRLMVSRSNLSGGKLSKATLPILWPPRA